MQLAFDLWDAQLPIEQKDVERAIRRYIRLIRCEETDSDKKKKLIVKLCDLRIRLAHIMEENDEKYLNGHRFNNKSRQTSQSQTCDVCLKKQALIMLPVAIFKSYQPNYVLSCDFCDYQIHRNCVPSVSTRSYVYQSLCACDSPGAKCVSLELLIIARAMHALVSLSMCFGGCRDSRSSCSLFAAVF